MKKYYKKSNKKLTERKLVKMGKDVVKKFKSKFNGKHLNDIIKYTAH